MKNSDQEKAERMKYKAPKVVKYGDIAKLTKTGQSIGSDGFAGSEEES